MSEKEIVQDGRSQPKRRQMNVDEWWKWTLRGIGVLASLIILVTVTAMKRHEAEINLACLRRGYSHAVTHWTPSPISFCVGEDDAIPLE